MAEQLHDANFPMIGTKTMHLNVSKGEVANRILSVGDHGRAKRIAALLDGGQAEVTVPSSRGFIVHSGHFKGVPVSVVGTGMGTPMMDFVVRECRHVVEGPMAIVRYGTTGILRDSVVPGTVLLASASRMVSRNYDYDPSDPTTEAYRLSNRVTADSQLTAAVKEKLIAVLGDENVAEGVDITADYFYDTQGRTGTHFEDYNEGLIERLQRDEPEASNLQMETFKLLQLAGASKGSIKAAGAAIGLLSRKSQAILSEDLLIQREIEGGRAILDALASFPL